MSHFERLPPTLKSLLRALVALVLAAGCFWFGIKGIRSGSIEYPSRYHRGRIVQATSPVKYWACEGFWLAGGLAGSWAAVLNLRKAIR